VLSRTSKASALRRVPLFSSCSKRELSQIAAMTTEMDVAPAEVIVSEGDQTREFYIIVSGTADVSRQGTLLRSLQPGDSFGELAILLDAPRSATVSATSSTHLLVIDEPNFFKLIHEAEGLHRKIVTALCERLAPVAL
jgi:CRP/FNR family transcriptional regulator, cyclic AMP receptor protein